MLRFTVQYNVFSKLRKRANVNDNVLYLKLSGIDPGCAILGAGAVTGFDIDEEALETAQENIQVPVQRTVHIL